MYRLAPTCSSEDVIKGPGEALSFREMDFLMALQPCLLPSREVTRFRVEPDFPYRFSRQFGFDQDVPKSSIIFSRTSRETGVGPAHWYRLWLRFTEARWKCAVFLPGVERRVRATYDYVWWYRPNGFLISKGLPPDTPLYAFAPADASWDVPMSEAAFHARRRAAEPDRVPSLPSTIGRIDTSRPEAVVRSERCFLSWDGEGDEIIVGVGDEEVNHEEAIQNAPTVTTPRPNGPSDAVTPYLDQITQGGVYLEGALERYLEDGLVVKLGDRRTQGAKPHPPFSRARRKTATRASSSASCSKRPRSKGQSVGSSACRPYFEEAGGDNESLHASVGGAEPPTDNEANAEQERASLEEGEVRSDADLRDDHGAGEPARISEVIERQLNTDTRSGDIPEFSPRQFDELKRFSSIFESPTPDVTRPEQREEAVAEMMTDQGNAEVPSQVRPSRRQGSFIV